MSISTARGKTFARCQWTYVRSPDDLLVKRPISWIYQISRSPEARFFSRFRVVPQFVSDVLAGPGRSAGDRDSVRDTHNPQAPRHPSASRQNPAKSLATHRREGKLLDVSPPPQLFLWRLCARSMLKSSNLQKEASGMGESRNAACTEKAIGPKSASLLQR